jgi:hypothetical protein
MVKNKKIYKKHWKKKGDISFLGMHVSNLIIAVICIIILIGIGYKIYDMFSEKTDLEKADSNLKLVLERLKLLKNTIGINTSEVLVYSPKDWLLRSYNGEFPQAECYSKVTCLCLCKKVTCANNVPKVCEGLDFLVEIPSSYVVPRSWYNPGKLFYDPTVFPNTIILEKAVEGLKLSKSNEKIIIEKVIIK